MSRSFGTPFGGAITDRAVVAAASSINDLATFTAIAWVNASSSHFTYDRIFDKLGADGWGFMRDNNAQELYFYHTRATTARSYTSNGTAWPDSVWQCVAVTEDTGASAALYSAGLTTAMAATGLATSTSGSGTFGTDNATRLTLGNNVDSNGPSHSTHGPMALFNRVLTLGELQTWKRRPRAMAGCVGLWLPGDTGANWTDLSGNGNLATVTGGVAANNPPIPPARVGSK